MLVFPKWLWIGGARLEVRPKKFTTQRVLRFSKDLHTQKVLLSNILGGVRVELRPGRFWHNPKLVRFRLMVERLSGTLKRSH